MPPKKILIVEDEAIVALDIQMHLEAKGFDAVTASTVSDAMSLVDDCIFVILDFHLGSDDSGSLARLLRARGIPFVVCSGSHPREFDAGFEGVVNIGKPYSVEHLDKILCELMG